jgi:glucokinase
MHWYLGIEVGGTKLQFGVGKGDGSPLRGHARYDINAQRGSDAILAQFKTGVAEVLARAGLTSAQVSGVGVGFGGPVNTAAGVVVTSHQVEGWRNFPLVAWIQSECGWRARLFNDADAAAWAEAHFGAGRGHDPVLYVTVGSGIGAGLVVNGALYRGNGAGAMEIGHLRPQFVPRHVGLPGVTVESIASGFGIQERARRVIEGREQAFARAKERFGNAVDFASEGSTGFAQRQQENYRLLLQMCGNDPQKITAKAVAVAAAHGDQLSRELLADAAETLGWALAQAIALVNPARIVVGGGVSLAGHELFYAPLRDACRGAVFKPFAGLAEIVPPALGEEVVVHGAMALARQELLDRPPLFLFEG